MSSLIIKILYISAIVIASLWIFSRFFTLFSLLILNQNYKLQKAEIFNKKYLETVDRKKLSINLIGNQTKPKETFIFVHDFFSSETDFDNFFQSFDKENNLAIIIRQRFNYNWKVYNISIYINDIQELINIQKNKYPSTKIYTILYGYSFVYLYRLNKIFPKIQFIIINPILKRRSFILNISNKLKVIICFLFTLRFKFKTRIKYETLTDDKNIIKKYNEDKYIRNRYMLDYLQFKFYNFYYWKSKKNNMLNNVIIFYNNNKFMNTKKIKKFKYKFKYNGNEYLGVNIPKFYEQIKKL